MTEPPRPPGEYGGPSDPTSSPPSTPSYPPPGEAPAAPGFGNLPPPTDPQQYATPPPGGYPPPAGYPAQPGYGTPPGAYQPAGYGTTDEKTWALVAHLGGAAGALITGGVGGWIAPLIALLAKGNESPTVRSHAVGALNFQITWSIVGIVMWILSPCTIGISILGAVAAMVISIVFGIIAGIKANEGAAYKYPMSINMVK
jgi:uncharacterized Tic20 family protein